MKVKPRCEPKKVKISGPAFTEKGVPASIPTDLIIDPTQAGFGDLEVQVMVSFIDWVFKGEYFCSPYIKNKFHISVHIYIQGVSEGIFHP